MHCPWIATCQCICLYIAVNNGESTNIYINLYIYMGGAAIGHSCTLGLRLPMFVLFFFLPNILLVVFSPKPDWRMFLLLFVQLNKQRNNKMQRVRWVLSYL